MTMIRTVGRRRRTLPTAVLALAAPIILVAGCGTLRPGDEVTGGGPARTPVPTPSVAADFMCPGESPSPTPRKTASTPDPTTPPTDHYAENHGFMVPFPLHGQRRCDGLAAVERVEHALEPLRERGDFAPQSTVDALTRLGYAAGSVQAYQNGPTGVSFLLDTYPVCVEGTMDRATTKADAFGGYPDHPGCDRPSGGH